MRKKVIAISIIALLTLASLPLVSGEGLYSIKKEAKTFENDISPSPGIIYDNLKIFATGTGIGNTILILLGRTVWFIGIYIGNHNDIPITLNQHITLIATKENRVLYEFDWNDPNKLPPGWSDLSFHFRQQEWRDADFTFGLFDLLVDINVPETGTDFTVVFHGFVWIRIGAFIFNRGGTLVE